MTMKRQVALLFAMLCGAGQAQQPIGSVGVQDVTIAGNLSVNNGRALLVGNTTLTAKDHAADVKLDRGGSVRVCATSGLHITAGKSGSGAMPLMLSLDRGAIEVRTEANASDVIMTPDLRFGVASKGPLDLRLRVTSSGDTCVENRGKHAPMLHVADQFGESSYDLRPGQHVLFEHGSLKEVVDNESSPCGCPPTPVVSVADVGVTSAHPAAPGSAAGSAAEQHPFPAAVSDGLAPAAAPPQTPSGVVHAQVATTLSYDANAGIGTSAASGPAAETATPAASAPEAIDTPEKTTEPQATASEPSSTTTAVAQTPPPPAPPHQGDVAHWIGHFFKRLFGRG
jgi:hypothetical protein